MALYAAFASSDGTAVDQHFGRAQRFVIYSIAAAGSQYLETRQCETRVGDEPGVNLRVRADLLGDCTLIVAQRFGRHASPLFDPARTELLELDGGIATILPALEKLVRLHRKYRT
jgi:nitrogen fixation protein NifX